MKFVNLQLFVKGWPGKRTENEQELIFPQVLIEINIIKKIDQQMIVVVLITYIWREIQNAEEVANKDGKQVESKQNLSLKLIKEFHLISI